METAWVTKEGRARSRTVCLKSPNSCFFLSFLHTLKSLMDEADMKMSYSREDVNSEISEFPQNGQ